MPDHPADDIVERLRDVGAERAGGGPGDSNYDPELLVVMYDASEVIETLRAHLAAPSDHQLPDGMVQVGWAGPEMSELAGPLYDDDELEPGEVVVDEEETETGSLRWTVNVGDWALRYEDGQNDLVDPWPVYGRRSDVPGEGHD